MNGSAVPRAGRHEGAKGVGRAKMNDLLQVLHADTPRTVRLVGELDASNAEDLINDLENLVGEDGDLVLDLSGLTFVDSMGLRSLLRIAEGLGVRKLILDAPQRPVARTIAIVGLDRLANIAVVNGPPADQA